MGAEESGAHENRQLLLRDVRTEPGALQDASSSSYHI